MGNLKSRQSLPKKWQASLETSVDDQIADSRQVVSVQVHADGRKSAFQPVYETASACLEPDFIVQVTGSTALNRNQARWFFTQKSCFVPSGFRKRPLTSSRGWARLAESWLWAQQDSLQQKRACVGGWEDVVPSGLFPPCPSLHRKSQLLYATHVAQAVRGNSRCSDSRSETRAASHVQF